MNIAHLTSVHSRYDTRIFAKMCCSLAKRGFKINLIVSDGNGNEIKDRISIFDVGATKGGRFSRVTRTTKLIFEKAKELNVDIYHLHDPELIHIGVKLKKIGKKVIFDVHENVSLQILTKKYLPNFSRKIISKIYRIIEIYSLKKFDAIILAEHSYFRYYTNLNKKIEVITNMPDLKVLKKFRNFNREKNEIFYIGGISNERGFDVMIKTVKILKEKFNDIMIHLIGRYDKNLLKTVDITDLNKNIKFYGRVPLIKSLKYSKNAKVGFSLLKPIPNYKESYSTKIFEYMALGLPVITSNFKLYKDIVEKFNCGLCVDPINPHEVAKSVEYIFNNPAKAKQMSLAGVKIVEEKFKWKLEEEKLYKLYSSI